MAHSNLRPTRIRRVPVRWVVPLVLGLCMGVAAAEQVDVAQELERLMAQHGFQMKPKDLDQTRDKKGRVENTELLPRLRLLLEGFDHIIVQSPGGGVDRVLILGTKVPYTPPPPAAAPATPAQESTDATPANPASEIVLDTRRVGASHTVSLTLEGESGRRVQRSLLVDTGADYVVLPNSLIPQLGLSPNKLRTQQVQTANGNVDASLGTLPAVWLKEQRVTGVAVAFIDDRRLGGNALLGMSLLSRFKLTIEDEHNQLRLDKK
jgi:aspartyl protease family protein